VVVYGNPEGEGSPIVSGLDLDDVDVAYTPSPVTNLYGYPKGSVTVSIPDFEYRFVVPFITSSITLPGYHTTLTAESAGMVPADITPSPTPAPSPSPTPTSTPAPTPTPGPSATPTATPTPAPTPRSCNSGERPGTGGCVCRAPRSVGKNGKCT
jgi:hypothetical protein